MAVGLKLEVFDADARDDDACFLDAAELERMRLRAFDEGYAAGWQDAVSEAEAADTQRRAAAEDALRALHFTHAEARAHALAAVLPLVRAMAGTVLPEMAQATLGATVAEAVAALAAETMETPVEVQANAATCAAIAPLIEAVAARDLRLIEEPSLADGQVIARLDPAATRIDIDAAVTAVQQAVADYLSTLPAATVTERKAHG
ncbi:MAG: flagellar biosynthesis protein [Rhodobacteraceae bacterium]|nr:flagellar biosynthesis protein [Paracoccaceae bacterium]